MRWKLALASVTLLGAIGSVGAEPLSGADLVRTLSDNTLTGFNGSLWFSEYHAPDGRILGHNAGVQNDDSCWKVRGDAVCYYYPVPGRKEGDGTAEFCWHLERMGQKGFRITSVGRGGSGGVLLEPGNPRNHTDNGRSWTCDALLSGRERPNYGSFAALHRRD